MIGLRYAAAGDLKQVEVTIPAGESFAGYAGPTKMVVLDIGNDPYRLAVAVRALIQGGANVADALPLQPQPVPDISDRQFARGLWGDGIITYTDFLDFIGPGTIPAPIEAIVSQLPDDDTGRPTPRKDAVGFLTGSKLYSFSHPLVEFFRQALAKQDPNWTPDYLRVRWLMWATL